MSTFLVLIGYFAILFGVGYLSARRRQLTSSDFLIGSRSMNYWLTALAAHASDMSSWLFMGYPAMVFLQGSFSAWTAVGLVACMFLNWQLVATKIRVLSAQYNAVTFSSFFESHFKDTSGRIRIVTAVMSLLFYTIYISSGLMGMAILLESLFGLPYVAGVVIGIGCVVPYLAMGGFITLAWIDLFQGVFLMSVVITVPLAILSKIGGWSGIEQAASLKAVSLSLVPDFSARTWLEILGMTLGWGLGYFGQPHIVTKFMGIRRVEEIHKSKYIGMSWMILSMGAATLVGLVGLAYFQGNLSNPEEVFVRMVKESFPLFLSSLILCSVVATTINAMSAQALALSSTLTEDFYKKVLRKDASSAQTLRVARLSILGIMLLAALIALSKASSINSLVFYAWSGLGSSFGPLMLLSLYSKRINRYGAWGGIITGGILSALWPYLNSFLKLPIPSMLPGFLLSFFSILLISRFTGSYVVQRETR